MQTPVPLAEGSLESGPRTVSEMDFRNPSTKTEGRIPLLKISVSSGTLSRPCITALETQACHKFEVSLGYTVRLQSGPAWATERNVSKSCQEKAKIKERKKGRKGGRRRKWREGGRGRLCFRMEVNASVSFSRTDKTTTGLETYETWPSPHKYPLHGSFPSVLSQPGYGSQASKSWGKLGLE